MKMPKARKNNQTQSHHSPGLAWTSQSAPSTTSVLMTAPIARPLTRSVIQSFTVMVLNPYLFSIRKLRYRLKGMPMIVWATMRNRKNSTPFPRNDPVRDVIHPS